MLFLCLQTISEEQFGRLCDAASSNSRLEGLLCSNTHMGDTYAENLIKLIESNPNIKEIRCVAAPILERSARYILALGAIWGNNSDQVGSCFAGCLVATNIVEVCDFIVLPLRT